MKQTLLAAIAAGAMLLSVAGVASAAPPTLPPPANCTAGLATQERDVAFFASMPHPGERSIVGSVSSSCGKRGGGEPT